MCQNLLEQTLTALSVRHTRTFVNMVYNEAIDKDNLFGISRMLQIFGINSYGYMCDDYRRLTKESNPLIVAIGTSFSLVVSIDENEVVVKNSGVDERMSAKAFLGKWNGAVLILEKSPDACEPDIELHIHDEINKVLKFIVFSISLGATVLYQLYCRNNEYGLGEWLLLILNILALSACALLVEKQIKGRSALGDIICSNKCNDVLKSEVSRPLFSISLSEIGISYFLINTLLLIISPRLMLPVATTILCSSIVSVWGLVYQFLKKAWCPLCVIVHLCVVLQCTDIYAFGLIDYESLNTAFIATLFLYPIATVSAHYIIKILTSCRMSRTELYRVKRIATNSVVFNYHLKQQRQYDNSVCDSTIIIGNKYADNTITIFSNPHCEPCAEAHRALSSLLKKSNRFAVKYIFSSFGQTAERDSKFLISCFKNQKETFIDLLDDWFNQGKNDPDRFIKSKGGFHHDLSTDKEYEKHLKWAETYQLRITPVIIVNGYQLPPFYSLTDLEYIVDFE